MPINFSLEPFSKVSDTFCETGTYFGESLEKALNAGFTNIASVEISLEHQQKAKDRIFNHHLSKSRNIKFILGDAEKEIGQLIDFAKESGSEYPIFWLDAHTYYFEDGSKTIGNPCPLIEEMESIFKAFEGKAIILIDDLRIIGGHIERKKLGKIERFIAAYNAFMQPSRLVQIYKDGWGAYIDLLNIIKLIPFSKNVSMKLLNGAVDKDVICIFPDKLMKNLFNQ